MNSTVPAVFRAGSSPYAIGDPGRAASELAAGPPVVPAGQPDVELSAATLPGMVIRAATIRGLLHRFNGTSGQDAFALAQDPAGRAIAVVCDGVGSLGRSREAAQLASRHLAVLGAAKVSWPDAIAQVNEELGALAKVAAEGGAADEGPGDAEADGMATTAVAAALRRKEENWVVDEAWVGDSSLWHLGADGRWTVLAGAPDDDEENTFHVTGVRPLPSADGSCSSRELIVPGGAIFLMSDGVGNPLRWSTEVQETLAEWWRQPPDPFSFAAQVAFARRSHTDDRTVIGIWPDGADR